MSRISISFILILIISTLNAQSSYWTRPSPYEFSWKKDLIITGVSTGTFIWGRQMEKNELLPTFQMGSFTQEDIEDINSFDRIVAGDWDIDAKDKGKIFKTTGNKLVPLGILVLPGSVKSRASLGLIYLQGRLLNGGLVNLAKGSTNRYRPFSYMDLENIALLTGEAKEEFFEDIADDDVEDSFYSGDAAATSYGLMFFAKVFNDYYPETKFKYIVWGAAGVGTGLGAYYRAKSGKHFPSDVIVGSLIGGGLGVLIPHLHKNKDGSNISLQPTKNGLSLIYNIK